MGKDIVLGEDWLITLSVIYGLGAVLSVWATICHQCYSMSGIHRKGRKRRRTETGLQYFWCFCYCSPSRLLDQQWECGGSRPLLLFHQLILYWRFYLSWRSTSFVRKTMFSVNTNTLFSRERSSIEHCFRMQNSCKFQRSYLICACIWRCELISCVSLRYFRV